VKTLLAIAKIVSEC